MFPSIARHLADFVNHEDLSVQPSKMLIWVRFAFYVVSIYDVLCNHKKEALAFIPLFCTEMVVLPLFLTL